MLIVRLLACALTVLSLSGLPMDRLAHAQSYEAHLPDDLSSHPALCERVPCAEVFPGAQAFSPRMGQPPMSRPMALPTRSSRASASCWAM